ncbi:MAG: ABC-F family ATP-binding cassette domain-containing protein [Defluviicoccus sp.]
MLRISDLTYRIGSRHLFDRAQATINTGHRVGLVGRNGAGKTTLLRLIAGELEPDGGCIEVPARCRIGLTRQDAPAGPESLIETVLAADSEVQRLTAAAEAATDPHAIAEIHARLRDTEAHSAPARAARILAGLGFSEAAQQQPCNTFSGGWRMRVGLAALLFVEPDILLLDEPTNHLDLEASLWLEGYLRRYPGTIVLVSHDRGLLNRAVGEILHVEGGSLTLYPGGYDRFEATRRARIALSENVRAKQAGERARIQAFVDRFRYKASKARQAQSRLKLLARMEPIAEAREEEVPTFAFPEPEALASPLLNLDGAAVGYDATPVLRKLSLRIDADDRIALLGANGNGKSTLMRLLAGRLSPLSGSITRSPKLRVGYFAQHQADELDLEVTPVVVLGRRRPRDSELQLRQHLGRFGFSQQRADTTIANLSGGEKARLLFALMSAEAPHLLLLDEPTNHLDLAAREALVQAINAFSGGVVIVSHDPHVIGLTADRLWLIEGGGVVPFDGDLDDYRALVLEHERADSSARTKASAGEGRRPGRQEQRRIAGERRLALAPLKQRLAAAEDAVERLHTEQSRLTGLIADPTLYQGDASALVALRKQLAQVEKDVAEAEAAWIAAHEAWEEAQAATAAETARGR